MIKIDESGQLVKIANDGLVKLDGITILRRVRRGDRCYLQFYDPDRMRSQLRKTRYVEIPVDVFMRLIQGGANAEQPVAQRPVE